MRAAFAAAALALVALVAVPSAATAVGPYTPSDSQIIVSSPTVRPGGTVTISFLPGSFNPLHYGHTGLAAAASGT